MRSIPASFLVLIAFSLLLEFSWGLDNSMIRLDSGLYDFRQIADPILLALTFVVAIVAFLCIRYLHDGIADPPLKKEYLDMDRALFITKATVLVGNVLLLGCAFFHLFGYLWIVAFQTIAFALFAIQSVWSDDEAMLRASVVMSVFNVYCLSGRFSIFGFSTALNELSSQECRNYYGITTSDIHHARCANFGFINFLRLLGLTMIILQAVVSYATLVLYRRDSRKFNSYEEIGSSPFAHGAGAPSPGPLLKKDNYPKEELEAFGADDSIDAFNF